MAALTRCKNFVKRILRYPSYNPQAWKDLQHAIHANAREFKVVSDIHQLDYIFRFILEHKDIKTPSDAVKYYFQDGDKSAKKLLKWITDLGVPCQENTSLLEFASGYGMVTRHLSNCLFPMKVVSCDIHEPALRFLKAQLGVKAVLSNSVPENIKLKESFDVVFALSFFSHMPHRTFGRWLNTLYKAVKPNGYLLFTTHGLTAAKKIDAVIPESGIWFSAGGEQKDLEASDYGTTCVTPQYVDEVVKKHLNATVHSHLEDAWWDHQDLYVIKRIP